jgi:osmotically-inducible protein OsmY
LKWRLAGLIVVLAAGCAPAPAPDRVSPANGPPAAVEPAPSRSSPLEVLKVKKAFMTSARKLDDRRIEVAYEDGSIHLRGQVPDSAQRSLAEELARGSTSTPIVNELKVGK